MVKRPNSERADWRTSIENGPPLGIRDDGSINSFPASELPARLKARDAEESISLNEMVRRMREDEDFEIEMLEGASSAEATDGSDDMPSAESARRQARVTGGGE